MGEIPCTYLRKRLQNIADNANRKAHNLYLNHTQATPNAGYVDYEDEETDCSSDISEVDLNLYTYKPSTSNRLMSLTDPKHKQLTPFVSQMRLGRPSIAVVGDSFGVSDWAMAAIGLSVLHDVGLITTNNSDLVVAKNELRREKAKLLAIGCDGTSINTGWDSCVIWCLELKLGKPLQRVICLQHFNELTLRHLFETLDVPTKGPKSYSGNNGKALLTLPMTTFEIIDGELLTTDRRDLSKDYIYLQEISQTVRFGTCSDELARRSPGTLSHSRRLTTANRVIRLYVNSPAPSLKLKQIDEFVMKVYTPNWFYIKSEHSLKDGAKYVRNTISTSKYLSQVLKNVVARVICRNSFFAHPGIILLCMLKDERPHIRELAARRIIKSRKSSSNGKSVHVFLPSKLNFEATNYTEMID
ncbi:hypothetical protein AVEN_111425-1 [Araneus ventricosus]|uniref:Uncharacterized protein n=1 Tax=Araneus ventricosus TaxID=182803 RepID=A0A4Y2HCL9_ARAVE|nr:hypothetical protein AVEN_111425-1 [Araneus ventricosus]